MGFANGWDAALLVVAGYVAVVALARLMLAQRGRLLGRFRAELEQEKLRQKQLEKQRKKQEQKSKTGRQPAA